MQYNTYNTIYLYTVMSSDLILNNAGNVDTTLVDIQKPKATGHWKWFLS